MADYFDTSALVKLVIAEPETYALRTWIADRGDVPAATSDLARTELLRAVRRGAPELVGRAREVLESLTILALRPALFMTAGRLDPAELRSLDALHLASALDLGDDLDYVVTYDDRLAAVAHLHGLAVAHPGVDDG
ncbi:MAG: type II toxin-antitoxin system VapC family toxin [Euzebya sp.]